MPIIESGYLLGLEKKAMSFRKENVMNRTMPITVKILVPSEDGRYPSQMLLELYWREDDYEDIAHVYTQEILQDIGDTGSLTGRAICAIDIGFEYPLIKELEKTIFDEVDGHGYWIDIESLEFQAFEIEEHSTGYLRGTLSTYEYFREDQSIERIPQETYVIIFEGFEEP